MDGRIPIYDATAPIACTLGEDELAERVALLERLRTELVDVERTRDGLLLTFPAQPAIEDDVRRFAVDEKRCCAFWGFEVTAGGAGVRLRWEGPPGSAELLDRLHERLTGDGPFDELRDLV